MLTHKDIDNTDKIETMRMELYNEEVLYEYEIIEHQYLGYFAGVGFFSVMSWMLYDFSQDMLDTGGVVAFSLLTIFMTLFFIFFGSADIKRIYKFTKNGILTEQADVVPEYAYQCMRMIGRVGVVACLVAVVFVGPMAFVGAGASALLSFKLVNFRLKPMMFESLYFDESVIFKTSKENYIDITANINEIFNTLREFYPNGYFYEVEEEDDIYSHYKYKEFLHSIVQD
ncbi:hypothetical protein AAFX60_006560 [Aliivibrio fischeri]